MTNDPLAPGNIRVCPECGVIVYQFEFPDGSVLVWDPNFVQRRFVRSWYGPGLVERHGFGPGWGQPHRCPPPEQRPVTPTDLLRRPAGGGAGEGGGGS